MHNHNHHHKAVSLTRPPRQQVRYGVAWFQGLRLDNAALVWTLTFTSSPPLAPVSSRAIQLTVGSLVGFNVLVRPAGCFAEILGGVFNPPVNYNPMVMMSQLNNWI